MNKQKGIASLVIMIAMLVMAIALPITTKLVQQNQENRSKATTGECTGTNLNCWSSGNTNCATMTAGSSDTTYTAVTTKTCTAAGAFCCASSPKTVVAPTNQCTGTNLNCWSSGNTNCATMTAGSSDTTYTAVTTKTCTAAGAFCCASSPKSNPNLPCSASNWSSVLSPTTCPASGQQTRYWTKVGTCVAGVVHPATETVSCTPSTSTNTCIPGRKQCVGTATQTCNTNNAWVTTDHCEILGLGCDSTTGDCKYGSVNGACGTTAKNTCAAGVARNIAVTATQYTWNCESTAGGITANCSFPISTTMINGVCGVNVNTCSFGLVSDIADSTTQYKWNCVGVNGGTSANNCVATISTNASTCSATNCQGCKDENSCYGLYSDWCLWTNSAGCLPRVTSPCENVAGQTCMTGVTTCNYGAGWGTCASGSCCLSCNESNCDKCTTINACSQSGCAWDYQSTPNKCFDDNVSSSTCAYFTYSNWSACSNGTQTRTVATKSPANCTGGNPVLSSICNTNTTCSATNCWPCTIDGCSTYMSTCNWDPGSRICSNKTASTCARCSTSLASMGDANCDGKINELDFAVWLSEYQKGTKSKADFNCSGSVGIDDFSIWNTNFKP